MNCVTKVIFKRVAKVGLIDALTFAGIMGIANMLFGYSLFHLYVFIFPWIFVLHMVTAINKLSALLRDVPQEKLYKLMVEKFSK